MVSITGRITKLERTPLTRDDVAEVLERANRSADGSYRTAAGRLLPGKVIGGFRYEGTARSAYAVPGSADREDCHIHGRLPGDPGL